MKDYLKDHLPADKSARILDIGCGDGDVLLDLKRQGYANCSGVEIDKKSIDACRQKGLSNVEAISDLAAYLFDKRGAFDLIYMKEVIYYFPEDKLAIYLKAIKDALKDDGTLIVEVFNGAMLTGAFFKYKDYRIKYVLTEHSLRRMLEDSGFRVTKVFGAEFLSSSVKRVIWKALRYLWTLVLRAIYALEIGIGPERPTIWSKLVVAVAKKG